MIGAAVLIALILLTVVPGVIYAELLHRRDQSERNEER